MSPAETENNVSIWERLNPEEAITKEHIEYLIGLNIGEFPRTDESYVNFPSERAKKKKLYMEEHFGLDFDEAAKLSDWDDDRLKKAKEKWENDEKVLPLPVAISVLHDVVATCHLYEDTPEADREKIHPLLIDILNTEIHNRVLKRKQREIEVSPDKSFYLHAKEHGLVTLPGVHYLPSGVLVNTLKRLESALASS